MINVTGCANDSHEYPRSLSAVVLLIGGSPTDARPLIYFFTFLLCPMIRS